MSLARKGSKTRTRCVGPWSRRVRGHPRSVATIIYSSNGTTESPALWRARVPDPTRLKNPLGKSKFHSCLLLAVAPEAKTPLRRLAAPNTVMSRGVEGREARFEDRTWCYALILCSLSTFNSWLRKPTNRDRHDMQRTDRQRSRSPAVSSAALRSHDTRQAQRT